VAWLPLANILHHKLRSLLASLGIGLGVCMLITLTGLARGSLSEVADRWESVDADLIVMPTGWGSHAATRSGSGLADSVADRIRASQPEAIDHIVPIFLWPMRLAGQDHMACGIDAADWARLTGGQSMTTGGLFDADGGASAWIEQTLLAPTDAETPLSISQADLAEHGCLELVVDERLAKAGGYKVGQVVRAANHDWTIVGIAPAGVMTRVFMPRRTAQFLFGSGDIRRSTFLFVKLTATAGDIGASARRLGRATGLDVVPVTDYRGMLMQTFGIMFRYIHAVNAVALVIAFLFITIMLYTTVIQQTREIAILKANGASNGFLLRQVMAESLLLGLVGLVVGVAMSLAAAWLIGQWRPLLTPLVEARWIVTAGAAALAGAVASSLYPAWRATRVDVAAALALD